MGELCRRLDGIPLAIELAAARIVHFGTPRALLGHLDNRLTLLRHGTPDRPQRHRTMHDAIDWSYSQLAGPERRPVGMNAPDAEQNAQFVLNVMHWLEGDRRPTSPPAPHW